MKAETGSAAAAEAAPVSHRGRRIRLAIGWLIAIGCLALLGRQFAQSLDAIRTAGWRPSWGTILAVPCVMLGQALVATVTHTSLAMLGAPPRRRDVLRVHFVSQLAKYLPVGGILNVAAQGVGLSRLAGGSAGRSLTAITLMMMTVCAAAASWCGLLLAFADGPLRWGGAAVLALPMFLLVLAAAPRAGGALARLGRGRVATSIAGLAQAAGSSRHIVGLGLLALVAWCVFGGSLVLIAGDAVRITPLLSVQLIGALSGGWLVGFLSFIVPAGLGVRDVSMMFFLGLVMPESQPWIVVFPVVSRLTWIAADLLNFAIAVTLLRRPARAADRDGSNT